MKTNQILKKKNAKIKLSSLLKYLNFEIYGKW